jgi:hypothetical protein
MNTDIRNSTVNAIGTPIFTTDIRPPDSRTSPFFATSNERFDWIGWRIRAARRPSPTFATSRSRMRRLNAARASEAERFTSSAS